MTDLRIEPLSTDNAAAAGAVLSASHHTTQPFGSSSPTRGYAVGSSSRSRPPPPGMSRPTAVFWARIWTMTSLVLHCGNHLAGFH
jgi:hypothetical protein